jgi:hypothetical protein
MRPGYGVSEIARTLIFSFVVANKQVYIDISIDR